MPPLTGLRGQDNRSATEIPLLTELPTQILNRLTAINHFATFDLFQPDGDLFARLGSVRADELLLRTQHSKALGNDIIGRTVMAAFELLRDELFLFCCQGSRHGSNHNRIIFAKQIPSAEETAEGMGKERFIYSCYFFHQFEFVFYLL